MQLDNETSIEVDEDSVEGSIEGELEAAIPRPCGFQVLIALPEIEDRYRDSLIAKSEETKKHDSILSMVGLVLDMGAQAYTDKDRFPGGAWCEIGQYVMFRTNGGTRFKVKGQEMRLLNDDSILAVVSDPSAIERVR